MKKKNKIDYDALEYFSGGVSAGVMFLINVDDLKQLVRTTKTKRGERNIIVEIAYIGLVSYFEAFCKDHFSSLINLCPQLTGNLRNDLSVNVTNILEEKEDIINKLGFYIAEKTNFGRADQINSEYQSLLSVTPFSGKESKQFDQIKKDRNLLVHHGGIYTKRYANTQITKKKLGSNDLFYDSLIISQSSHRTAHLNLESVSDCSLKWLTKPPRKDSHEKDHNTDT